MNYSEDILADYDYFLSVCPPDRAVAWLKSRERPISMYRNRVLLERDDVLDQILLARGDDYIDYGLARYSFTLTTARAIYDKQKANLRHVLLRHFPFCGADVFKDHQKKFRSPNKEAIRELECLLGNPLVGDKVFENFLSRDGYFGSLSDEDYIKLMIVVGSNPRLQRDYSTIALDGYDEYRYNQVFTRAWNLTFTVPTTQLWAEGIFYLLHKAQPPQTSFDIKSALDRWQIDAPNLDKAPDHLHGYSLLARSRIADLFKLSSDMAKSDDLAVRQSYYRRLDPSKDADWLPYLQFDKKEFIESILSNENAWKTEEARELLSEICWKAPDPHNSMDTINLYNFLLDQKQKTRSDWFKKDKDVEPRD